MDSVYKYTSSIDYIESLTFDYLETYSFQRGLAYEENLHLIKAEHDILSAREKKYNNLTPTEKQRFSDIHKLIGYTQYLIDDEGLFHPSSEKINTFSKNAPAVDRLRTILQTEIRDIPMWLCSPIYRDAIVFYNSSEEVISVLNICLSCQYMETQKFNHINGDYKTYDLLKKYFIDIGHHVEEQSK